MSSAHYPSLLLVASNHEAKWFRVEENGVLFLAEHYDEKAAYSDKEAHSERGKDDSQGGATDVYNTEKSEEAKIHLANAAAQTAKLWPAEQYVHLMVAVPEQSKNLMHEKLQAALPQVSYKYIVGNHTKDPAEKLLGLAKESLKAF